jgi:hypothetical protein
MDAQFVFLTGQSGKLVLHRLELTFGQGKTFCAKDGVIGRSARRGLPARSEAAEQIVEGVGRVGDGIDPPAVIDQLRVRASGGRIGMSAEHMGGAPQRCCDLVVD